MKRTQLRDRITIQELKRVRDPKTGTSGGEQWVDILTNIPADVEYLSAGQRFAAAQAQTETKALMLIRYRKFDFDNSMRVIFDGQEYQITGFMPDNENRRRHITLMVTTGVKK